MSTEIRITEVFFQEAQPEVGIPSHYAVQFVKKGKGFVDYEYFNTEPEALTFAKAHGWED